MPEIAAKAHMDSRDLANRIAALLLFIIAAGNGVRIWWSGLAPALVLSGVILLLLSRRRYNGTMVGRVDVPLVGVLFSLVALAALSMIVAVPSLLEFAQFLGSYLVPLLLYLTFQRIQLNEWRIRLFWKAITFGALVPLVAGLVAYYQEWGIPTGAELLYSRYDLDRMQGYLTATFGNTSNTASFLALLVPSWLVLAMGRQSRPLDRLFYAFALVVGIAHTLIVESRTLYLTLLVMIPAALVTLRVSFRVLLVIGVIVLGVYLQTYDLRDQIAELTVGAFQGSESDQSLSERLDAMSIGIRLIGENPLFGIGPGNSLVMHVYTSSHQYWINEGVELGLGGLVASFALSILVFRNFVGSAIYARRRFGPAKGWSFVNALGTASFMLYGCIGNMTWSSGVVVAWAGLFGSMLGLCGARWAAREAITAKQAFGE